MMIAVIGLLGTAGQASAVACSTVTTIGAWAALGAAGCTDSDNDTRWTWTANSANINSVGFSVNESEAGGVDFYTVSFDFTTLGNGGLQSTSATLNYTATNLNAERFVAANFDTSVSEPVGTSGATATDTISPAGLVLSSPDGRRDPLSGETPFATSLMVLNIADVWNPGAATPGIAILSGSINSFQVGVPSTTPEPASLLLLGLGLGGVGVYLRRKRN